MVKIDLKDKKVVVGVTGGIAAYKAAELVRLLIRAEVDTRVAMTAHATKFVAPLTFEALSGNRVVWNMWDHGTVPLDHISWGQESDLIIIAPATANMTRPHQLQPMQLLRQPRRVPEPTLYPTAEICCLFLYHQPHLKNSRLNLLSTRKQRCTFTIQMEWSI